MTSNTLQQPLWPRAGVSIMVFRGEHVLLGQRSKPPLRGLWSLPGGHIEAGETVDAAALRELREETGVHAEIIGHAGTRDIIQHDTDGSVRLHYVLSVLVGRWQSGDVRAASDCLAAEWVRVSDLASFDMTEGTADLIRRTFSSGGGQLDPSREPV